MTHTVKKGENLTSIAKKYGVTVEALVASNGIKDKNLIRVGQVLTIPSKAPTVDAIKIINDCVKDIQALPSFKKFVEMMNK